MGCSCLARSENEITGDNDAHRPAGPHADRWLNTEIAFDDALSGLVDGVGGAAPYRALDIAVAICAKLCADPENGRQACRDKHAIPMMIGAV
tara:strand:+ start:1501 stop:1776 length:276 start_codon:yes stop_codon:yes gene_type:complete